jgi:hypothetical protein
MLEYKMTNILFAISLKKLSMIDDACFQFTVSIRIAQKDISGYWKKTKFVVIENKCLLFVPILLHPSINT